jgi:acyl carrier protein
LADVGQILRSLEARAPDARAKEETAYAAPRTPIEEMLANLWASTLKLDRVGINDNFFKSGGHSLLGTLLISRIRDTFQVELPLLSLFDAPTVAGLAEIIEQQLLGQVEAGELSEMMQGVEQLTDEEVKALLLDEAAQLEHDEAAG